MRDISDLIGKKIYFFKERRSGFEVNTTEEYFNLMGFIENPDGTLLFPGTKQEFYEIYRESIDLYISEGNNT